MWSYFWDDFSTRHKLREEFRRERRRCSIRSFKERHHITRNLFVARLNLFSRKFSVGGSKASEMTRFYLSGPVKNGRLRFMILIISLIRSSRTMLFSLSVSDHFTPGRIFATTSTCTCTIQHRHRYIGSYYASQSFPLFYFIGWV